MAKTTAQENLYDALKQLDKSLGLLKFQKWKKLSDREKIEVTAKIDDFCVDLRKYIFS